MPSQYVIAIRMPSGNRHFIKTRMLETYSRTRDQAHKLNCEILFDSGSVGLRPDQVRTLSRQFHKKQEMGLGWR